MTAPAVIASGVGARSLTIFALNASTYIDATSPTAPYQGLAATGLRSLELNDPQPRFITHVGDDSPFALDILPPLEAITGSCVVSKQNDTLDAALTGLKSFTVGETKMFPVGTNLRGFERTMGALVYQQAEITDPSSSTFGNRVWLFKILPQVIFFPIEPGMNDNPEARTYAIRPGFVTKHIWGTTLTVATEGATRAQIIRGISQYKPKLIGWLGNNSTTVFTFPTDAPLADTAKIAVWLDGVLQTSGMTITTASVTFAAAPGSNVNITMLYETPNTPV